MVQVVSFDIGSRTAFQERVPGVAEHAIATRPIHKLVSDIDRRIAHLDATEAVDVVVVGAGAAGIEVRCSSPDNGYDARYSQVAFTIGLHPNLVNLINYLGFKLNLFGMIVGRIRLSIDGLQVN